MQVLNDSRLAPLQQFDNLGVRVSRLQKNENLISISDAKVFVPNETFDP